MKAVVKTWVGRSFKVLQIVSVLTIVAGLGFSLYTRANRMSPEQRAEAQQQAVEDENVQRWIIGMFVAGDAEAARGNSLDAIHIYGKVGPVVAGDSPMQVKMRAELLARIAAVRVDRKEEKVALALSSEAIRIQPDCAFGFYSRGLAYCGLKKYDEAKADLKQAVKLGHPGAFETWERVDKQSRGGNP